MASHPITRVTMFKIPKKEDQEVMLKNYEEVGRTNLKVSLTFPLLGFHHYFLCCPFRQSSKINAHSQCAQDGKPYILSLEAGLTYDDARSQGYTLVAKTMFKNKEDFDYYDTECEAHKILKAKAKSLDVQGVLMIYFTPDVAATL
jgi:hypothetical protein